MDEKELSALVAELGRVPAVCFKSAPHRQVGKEVGVYETVLFSVSTQDLIAAVDRSTNNAVVMHVNGELSTRKFLYGVFGGRIALVESMLLENAIVNGFQPLNVRAASWRTAGEEVAA